MSWTIGPDEKELERDVLRLLCSGLLAVTKRVEICGAVEPRLFHDALHRALFEEIRFAGPIDPSYLREILPGRMTNRGFPDFDLAHFYFPAMDSEEAIEALLNSVGRLSSLRGVPVPQA